MSLFVAFEHGVGEHGEWRIWHTSSFSYPQLSMAKKLKTVKKFLFKGFKCVFCTKIEKSKYQEDWILQRKNIYLVSWWFLPLYSLLLFFFKREIVSRSFLCSIKKSYCWPNALCTDVLLCFLFNCCQIKARWSISILYFSRNRKSRHFYILFK